MLRSAVVLGSGIIGLCTAIELQRTGLYNVSIWSSDLTTGITSYKAGAVWYPYIAEPEEIVSRWAGETYTVLVERFVGKDETGVCLKKATEMFDKKKEHLPLWQKYVKCARRATTSELMPGFIDGVTVEQTPIMDVDKYMSFLKMWFHDLGGSLIQKKVNSLDECFETFSVVINCTGLGSRTLVSDSKLSPVRGQTVRIAPNGFDRVVMGENDAGLSYIIPLNDSIVVGGTAQEGSWDEQCSACDTKQILERVGQWDSRFEPDQVCILEVRVGLRPKRDTVRVELDEIDIKGKRCVLVHNYGHGGSGYTIGWGCAKDVVKLILSSSCVPINTLTTQNKSRM